MSVSYGGDSITFADGSVTSSGWTGYKNRIINGAMVIDQRYGGATANVANSSIAYSNITVDRFGVYKDYGSAGYYLASQSSTAPEGFTKSLYVTTGAAFTPTSATGQVIRQVIEGYNIADLDFGTSAAKTFTLSFWVRSSLTGTFSGAFHNVDSSRSYAYTYVINQANTWEYKTVTVPGCTDGTWNTTNGIGLRVFWDLGTGSDYRGAAGSWYAGTRLSATGAVKLSDTTGANIYITGVQLEKGSTASSFEYRPYGTELALCQRYYYQSGCALGSTANDYEWLYTITSSGTSYRRTSIRHPVPMRAAPTLGNMTVRINDASTASTTAQYITNVSWSVIYNASSTSDYIACNGYTVTAEF